MNRNKLLVLGAAALGATFLATPASAQHHGGPGADHAMSAAAPSAGRMGWRSGAHSPGFAQAPSMNARGAGPAFTVGRSSRFAPSVAARGFARDFDRGDRRHRHRDVESGVFAAPGFAYEYPDAYNDYDPGYVDASCTQLQRVATPWGLRWQRVWVCN